MRTQAVDLRELNERRTTSREESEHLIVLLKSGNATHADPVEGRGCQESKPVGGTDGHHSVDGFDLNETTTDS